MQSLPDDYLAEAAKYIISLLLGAGGVAWFRIWLENRRLTKKEFRETLLDRVRELERTIASLQVRMGNLRVEMAHLEVENAHFRRTLGLPHREDEHADKEEDGQSNGEPA